MAMALQITVQKGTERLPILLAPVILRPDPCISLSWEFSWALSAKEKSMGLQINYQPHEEGLPGKNWSPFHFAETLPRPAKHSGESAWLGTNPPPPLSPQIFSVEPDQALLLGSLSTCSC